jgi:hypothetical protein
MFCPECGSEYRPGFYECADCGVALVSRPPVSPRELAHLELVSIYRTSSPAFLPVIESLLAGAQIQFMAKGVGWGRFHTGVNPVAGPVEFFVREDQAEEARRILSELARTPPQGDSR